MALGEFEDCVSRGFLKKEPVDARMVEKELAAAVHDLASAKKSLEGRDFPWAVAQSYYSCFHSAKALVLNKGYREKSHFCLAVAFGELYRGFSEKLGRAIFSLKRLREAANYSLEELGGEDATSAVEMAEEFLEEAEKLLKAVKK